MFAQAQKQCDRRKLCNGLELGGPDSTEFFAEEEAALFSLWVTLSMHTCFEDFRL